MNITNYKHKFQIENQEIEIIINCKNGYWTSDISKGNTGTVGCSGGKYENLEEYIKEQEKQHRYSFNFFNYGLGAAKNAI